MAFVWQAGLEAMPALLPCCLAALLPCCLAALVRQVVAMAAGDSAAVQAAVRQAMANGMAKRKAAEWGEIGISPPKTGPFIRKKRKLNYNIRISTARTGIFNDIYTI